jgi:Flp pilus assembly protein protease CpaA
MLESSMSAVIPLPVTLAAVATAIAAVSELRTRQVPNLVTLPLLFVGMAVTVWERNFYAQLIGLAIVAVCVIPAYGRGLIGGGVTKLILGIGLCVGAWMAGFFVAALIVLSGLFVLASRLSWVKARLRPPAKTETDAQVTLLPGAPLCFLALAAAYGLNRVIAHP